MKKFLLIIFIFILSFFIGFFIAKFTSPVIKYKDAYYTTNLTCKTKNKINVKIEATLHYDNPEKKSEFIIKQAMNESCNYVFNFYTYKEVINDKSEIQALTTEDIFNRLQDKGFTIYDFRYEVKEFN